MNYDDLSELYDQQYDLYRDDLHFYASLAEGAGRVLEVGAGTGRVSCHLARRGADVTGLEPSGRMLERARARAAESRVDVAWLQGDAASFRSDERFDLIIAPFNALMHLYTPEEQLSSLENLARHLAPGGRFAFDLYVPNYGAQGVLRHEGETLYRGAERTDVFLMQRIDAARQHVTTEYFVDTVTAAGDLKRQHFTLTQRYYWRYEVEWLLRCAGFATPRVSGSFQGGPLTESSEVMVFQTRLA
ncbi:class I SAM-dependent methyltransferase [Deinococcus radiophilus]|uniref:Class I SAM-dependent methyltransferase n=1 Tax=Deinococcus radiophilus TaxID=32062 RepID=A0A3S0IQU9_9DEIO|nr:class I SAM-dependent methyltransferase [Deinococcus radiophilus]RTR29401.1 class I SAM-dependent methyltransferase [Deinococcus radiophilus]UFA50771.1 class I SAM-dependent methyltransferase [Deinococcus radiophilus]